MGLSGPVTCKRQGLWEALPAKGEDKGKSYEHQRFEKVED
jgi:hypothetical protein